MSRSPEQVVVVGTGDLLSARGRPAGQRRGRAASQERSNGAGGHATDYHLDDEAAPAAAGDEPTVSVAEAARLLGRDRTRVYALLRSGDLVAVSAADGDGDGAGPVRIERSSLERWLVAGGDAGRPLSPRNAWALLGLACGDQPFSERTLGLLEHAEELSRTRARLARESLIELAPRLRRRAMLVVRRLPRGLRQALEQDAAVVRTGASAAGAYGWDELTQRAPTWSLDRYLSVDAFSALQEQLNRLDIDDDLDDRGAGEREGVLLRVVEEPWPFPPHYPLAPQPLPRSTCSTTRTTSPGALRARC